MITVFEYVLSPFAFLYYLVTFRTDAATVAIALVLDIITVFALGIFGMASDTAMIVVAIAAYVFAVIQYSAIRHDTRDILISNKNQFAANYATILAATCLLIVLL